MINYTIINESREVSQNTPVLLNKRKNLESFVYLNELKDETGISYLEYEDINFKNHIYVNQFFNPPQAEEEQVFIFSTNQFTLPSRNFLITNKAISGQGKEIPLFFGEPVLDAQGVNLTDSNTDEEVYFQFDEETSHLYTNRTSTFEPNTLDYRGLTIAYLSNGNQVSRMFLNSPVFREATFDDIDLNTGELRTDRNTYIVNEENGLYKVKASQTTGPYYVKLINFNNFRLKKFNPTALLSEPWLLSVNTGIATEGGSIYQVNENDSSRYFPYFPYFTEVEKATLVDSKLLKLSKPQLTIRPNKNIHCSVIHRDQEFNVLGCYTTKNSLIGKAFDLFNSTPGGAKWERLEYEYDSLHSVLKVNNSVRFLETDLVEVSYCHVPSSYVINDINLNPHQNKDLTENFYSIYLKPVDLDERSVNWLLVSANGHILKSSDNNGIGLAIEDFYSSNPEFLELGKAGYLQYLYETENTIDIRKPIDLNPKTSKEFIKKYPRVFWNKLFSNRNLELPLKGVLNISVDSRKVAADKKDYLEKVSKFKPIGSLILLNDDVMESRVSRIYSTGPNMLYVDLNRRGPFDFSFYLYILKDSYNNLEDIEELLQAGTLDPSGGFTTLDVDTSTLTNLDLSKPRDFVLKIKDQDDNVISNSNVFTVLIKE